MDIVLGVSMAPSNVRLVLVEGENADGATVDEDAFELDAGDGSPTADAADRVIAAILGTRESAAGGDYHLTSTGVTWTDPVEAAVLRDALAAHKVENVMLVSAFLATAALAQSVGSAVGYAQTGLLFLEPDSATLAVVNSADGSLVDVRRQAVRSADAPAELAAMVAGLEALESRPDGVFVVGCGVDIGAIKPQLEAATMLPISGPEEPESALARGAALASANAPLFASSTAALAYAQLPDWTTAGVVDPYAIGTDPDAEGFAGDVTTDGDEYAVENQGRKPFLVALTVMTVFFVGVMALVISLGVSVRPTVSQRPSDGGHLIVPAKAAPPPPNAEVQIPPAAPPMPQVSPEAVPAPEAPAPAPAPAAPAPVPEAAAPAPAAPAPLPMPAAVVPATEAPAALAPPPRAPAPAAPAPAPPAAPAPAPLPAAPVPVPVPVAPVFPVLPPPIFNPSPKSPPVLPGAGGWQPGGGDRGGWQPGGGNRGGWQPGGGSRGGGGWLPGGGFGGGGFGGGHGGGGFDGGHGGGFGGFGGGGHGGFGGGHGGFGGH